MGDSAMDSARSRSHDRVPFVGARGQFHSQYLAGGSGIVDKEHVAFVVAVGLVLIALSATITSQVIDRNRSMEFQQTK